MATKIAVSHSHRVAHPSGKPYLKYREPRAERRPNRSFKTDGFAAAYDEFAVQFFDEDHSSEEARFLMLGMSSGAKLLIVCHCEREHGTAIRIISARKATKRESAFYQGG